MITMTDTDGSTAINYSQYRFSGDRSVFHGPAATDLNSDELIIKSTDPKCGNGKYGNRRSEVSLVRGTSVQDLEGVTVVVDRKVGISGSVPVGTSLSDVIADCYHLGSLLQDATFVEDLFFNGRINL